MWTGGAADASISSSSLRLVWNGSPHKSRSPMQSTSKKTIDAGVCCGQKLYPGSCRMNAQLQQLKIETAISSDDDFPIEYAARRQLRTSASRPARENNG